MRKRRRWLDRALFIVSGGCALLACGVLACIVGAICFRGFPAISWTFLTEKILQVGADGGVYYNLVGTLILIGTAGLVSTPIAIGLALTQSVYLKSERGKRFLGVLLYLLNGVPSILFGIFGFIVFVKGLNWGKSWLSGGLLLGFMILPTVTVALIERIKVLPRRYIEAATGLGLTRSQIVRSVILPQSFGALVTGLLLGLARAAGETAPIMFTATMVSGEGMPHGIRNSPVLSLPYHIFNLAQDSFAPGIKEKVWGSALVLLALVFFLSLIALPMRLKVHEEANHA